MTRDELITLLRNCADGRCFYCQLMDEPNCEEKVQREAAEMLQAYSQIEADLNAAKKEIKNLRRLRATERGNCKVVTYAAGCEIPRDLYDAISPERRDDVIKQSLREKVISLMVDRIYDDRAFTRITSYEPAMGVINVRDKINVIVPEVENE